MSRHEHPGLSWNLLPVVVVLALGAPSAVAWAAEPAAPDGSPAVAATCCGACGSCGGGGGPASRADEPGGPPDGRGCGRGQGAAVEPPGHHGDGAGMAEARETIHLLLQHHDRIERHVELLEDGVVATTTSADPEIAAVLRRHVRAMQSRLDAGDGMRYWDPLFAELFLHHDHIVMQVEDLPDGVRVRETSTDPEVVALLQQHATRAVSEFVEQGFPRAHEPTPLPGD